MWFHRLFIGAALTGTLAACAVVDPVDNRYDTISRSLAKSRNESIFLNLVRASHDYPLSFVTIANVTPGMTNTTSLALPSFLLGPHIGSYSATGAAATAPLFTPGRDVIFGNTTAGNTTAVTSNFNISTQETSTFYQGFLRPVDLQTLDYFIRQGYSRELLFWLFTDSFELTPQEGQAAYGYHYSPPDDYGCSRPDPKHRCFVDWVHNAAFTGLTVEEKTAEAPSSATSRGGASPNGSAPAPKALTYARFCFNQVLGQQAAAAVSPSLVQAAARDLDGPMGALYTSDLACGTSWTTQPPDTSPQADILPLQIGPISFRIIPRSAYGVFEFLGTLMKMQKQHMTPSPYAYIPLTRGYVTQPPTLETVHDDPNLITVVQELGGECFVHTWFEDGEYCVPDQAATTKKIFSLLAQLIAIETAASDLSITPIVRITQ
jgi:hypothetical protein